MEIQQQIKRLILDYARLFYRTFTSILRFFQRLVSPSFACYLQNIFLFFHSSSLRFKYDQKSKLFIAKQNNLVRYFGDMDRGFDSYGRNILSRSEILENSYCLKNINFSTDDIVVDCGANYGDLFLSLREKIPEKNYIAFEPGPIEYQCLLNSLPNSKIFNLGLSDKDGELDFYLCSKTADSSFVEPKSFSEMVKIKVTSMDSIFPSFQIDKCKLFKLEAEGWEPEILQGARDFMKICEYIAIDGGPERGIEEEITFHTLNNDLLNSGFEMIAIHGESYRALYRNISFKA